MATTPSHNRELLTWENGVSIAVPNSDRYTKFLFVVTGCKNNTDFSVQASLVGSGATLSAVVPLIISSSVAAASTGAKPAADTVAFQVDLCAPALSGLTLHFPGNDAAGSAAVSMWGSIYSQGLK